MSTEPPRGPEPRREDSADVPEDEAPAVHDRPDTPAADDKTPGTGQDTTDTPKADTDDSQGDTDAGEGADARKDAGAGEGGADGPADTSDERERDADERDNTDELKDKDAREANPDERGETDESGSGRDADEREDDADERGEMEAREGAVTGGDGADGDEAQDRANEDGEKDGESRSDSGDGPDDDGARHVVSFPERHDTRRARRRKILRRTAIGLVAVLVAGTGGAYWLYRDLMGGIEQKNVGSQLGTDRPQKLNESLNILLLGSDTREGDNAEYAVPGMAGARSDTTILLHLSPNRDQAVAVSFPRDSMVKIPECEKEDGGEVSARFGMLNSAFAYAGPTCTWKTLESLTGVHIDHFVQIDFSGFKRMVDALGGVEICVEKPVNDPRAELYLDAGKQTVKGDKALGYVRARYSLGNGSDLGRIERQQKFMAAVVDKALSSDVLTDPAKTYDFLKAATDSITTDDEFGLSDMRKLAEGLRGMSAGQVRFVTVPVKGYKPDPNRVQWNDELADPMFEAIRHDDKLPAAPAAPADAKPAPKPKDVEVTVVSAGARDKAVDNIVRQLERRGFKVADDVQDAPDAPDSRIVFAPTAEAQASVLARDAPDALLTPDGGAPKDGVRLVIGKKGLKLAPPPIQNIGEKAESGKKLCE
ncbi:LCP family protein [Actinomadura rifamycini]|uniref:LCP family protein n=1 Tax=Actinomadura rifamycini TaxID=31962 RepID=UPI0003FEEA69|nr:LCP family protein [Actinomadura rifamycini]